MDPMSRKPNRFERPLIYRKRENLTQVLRVCARTNYSTFYPWLVPQNLLLYVTRISNFDQVQDTEDTLPSIFYMALCSPDKKQKLFTS